MHIGKGEKMTIKINKKTYKRAYMTECICLVLFFILLMTCEEVFIWHFVALGILAIPMYICVVITRVYEDYIEWKRMGELDE